MVIVERGAALTGEALPEVYRCEHFVVSCEEFSLESIKRKEGKTYQIRSCAVHRAVLIVILIVFTAAGSETECAS